jgi:hypothetical protein
MPDAQLPPVWLVQTIPQMYPSAALADTVDRRFGLSSQNWSFPHRYPGWQERSAMKANSEFGASNSPNADMRSISATLTRPICARSSSACAASRAHSRMTMPGASPAIFRATSHVAFCVWPICPATRSTGLAGMKRSFGARPARSCLLSMHWIVANLKREGVVSVSVAGNTGRPTDTTTIEPP